MSHSLKVIVCNMRLSIFLSLYFILVQISKAKSQLYEKNNNRFLDVGNIICDPLDPVNVEYHLWTRNVSDYIPIQTGELNNVPYFRLNKKVIVITHGYYSSSRQVWVTDLKDEYLRTDDYNIILVDWMKNAADLYTTSACHVKEVGTLIGQLVIDIHKSLKIPYDNFHLIGHSLGAHIMARAGNYVQNNEQIDIPRITGLDPAGPLFLITSTDNRLDAQDAAFVDVIHTDAMGLGYPFPMGHVDFFPNGGKRSQPGCDFISDLFSCSHSYSHELFRQSINTDNYEAKECESQIAYVLGFCDQRPTAIMGENVNRSSRGVYHLSTVNELYSRNYHECMIINDAYNTLN